ncbi:MAG: hypothetical protein Tp178MES00d2C33159851_52 [Prokaryotic dsDNA virus sp.]|nr:MAG: hypothetical protein Tp178MES00d2C33159851_52 [Prokaryotic dsDNA virus sp.]|tara:strand:+ start:70539 stop:70754 length:216 start_codon:yes stop_codon:yes gene_type:complete
MSQFNQQLAIKHREQYMNAMMIGANGLCLSIEAFYGLDGYPPHVVSIGLNAACEGQCPFEAVDNYFDFDEE